MRAHPQKRPELLAPAGDPETLAAAIHYGADAVYLGGKAFGLRAKADNFSPMEMQEAIAYAHAHGVRVYVTVNVFAHQDDLAALRTFLPGLQELRPDGLLIADPGVFLLAQELCPDIPKHISTQANNTNALTCRFWQEQGAARIVLARELSLAEIREIRERTDLELEAFVHGAMCMSYSGRCLLSNYLTGRDANRGACTHPCRWKYSIMEETRPGEFFPVVEEEGGTTLFNSKDLCMIAHLPELLAAGIDSLKIEGRMKNALYVASVVRAYRKAIDWVQEDPEEYRRQLPWLEQEVARNTNRQFTTGFFFGKPSAEDHVYAASTYQTGSIYLGTVQKIKEDGRIVIEQKNKFAVGDQIEILRPGGDTPAVIVRHIASTDGEEMPDAPHAKQELILELEGACRPEVGDVLCKKPASAS